MDSVLTKKCDEMPTSPLVVTGDGVPLPDQEAALEEFKRQCLQPAPPIFKNIEPLDFYGAQASMSTGGGLIHIQGTRWLTIAEAEALRDWLTKVLP